MKIPDWLKENHAYLISNIHDFETLKRYTINHDCGKHLVKIEEDGKIHYPGHARASYEYYKQCFPEDTIVQELILNDMFIHTCTAEMLCNEPISNRNKFTHLLVGLSELHANAQLFGGSNETSFKIKYKQIDRRGRALCKDIYRPDVDYGHSYVFCRGDLSPAQVAVQAGHSLLELSSKIQFKHHPSLVYIVVRSEFKLKEVMKYLLDNSINYCIFREPDLNNEITSVATEPLTDKRSLLKKYMLYK